MGVQTDSATDWPKRGSVSGKQLHQKRFSEGHPRSIWRTTAGPPPEAFGGNSATTRSFIGEEDKSYEDPAGTSCTTQKGVIKVHMMHEIIPALAKRQNHPGGCSSRSSKPLSVMKLNADLTDL